MIKKPSKSDDCDWGNPGKATCGRFSLDALLRDKGFKIKARPRKGQAIWECGGLNFTFKEALETLRNERDLERAEKEELDYYMNL